MAKGFDKVAQATQQRAERQKQFDANAKPQLWLKDGQSAVIRFLEQGPDVHVYTQHTYSVPGEKFDSFFVCLNDNDDGTQCPGCDAGLKERVRGVHNVIQRDRPVLRKGKDGKAQKDSAGQYIVDGTKDEVVIFEVGSITAELFRQADTDYKGLMSRDFFISKTSGSSFQPYVLRPADVDGGAIPMSQDDLELAKKLHNLDEFMAPPTFVEAARIAAGQGGSIGQQSSPEQQTVTEQPVDAGNPFLGENAG